MSKLTRIWPLVILFGCSPKVITHTLTNDIVNRVHLHYEPFAFIELDTLDKNTYKLLGQIEIRDNGLTYNCDYEAIKRLAKLEGLKLGGNCLVITEHKLPGLWSSCHRIKANVISITNPRDYENEVIWHQNRKLTRLDFKGSVDKRPAIAATLSSFRVIMEGRPLLPKNYKLYVETYFDCQASYFKYSDSDAYILAHEQVHFDITELHARKFKEQVILRNLDFNSFLTNYNEILDSIYKELRLMQDEYDSDVYSDPEQQREWEEWISTELQRYQRYSGVRITVDWKK